MKIIQLPRRFVQSDWGGTETVILETSKHLVSAGHKTEILCLKMLTSIESELINEIEVNRVPYFYPYFSLGKNAKARLDKKAGNAFSFSLLHKLFTIKELDIIHLHTGKRIGGIARTIAKLRKIPYVISLHGGIFDVPQVESQSWTNPTQKALEWGKILGAITGSRRVLQDAAAIICVGYNEYKAIKEKFPGKMIFYLPNGVDCARFNRGNGQRFRDTYKIPVNRKILLNVGRIDPQKNQISLVQALPELMLQYDDIHLVLIGPITDSEYYKKIKNLIKHLKLEDRITLIEGIASTDHLLSDAYHAAEIFILPSIHEPFGIVVLEAWASGTPVIAANVGGIKHLIEPGVTGITYESGDDGSMISKIRQLIENRDMANKLAIAGEKMASDNYDWKLITKKLIKLYQSVLNENTVH